MTKILFWMSLLLTGAALWFTVPLTQETVICYKSTQLSFDEIGFRTRTSGWNERRICEEKTDVVLQLAECLETVRKTRNKTVMTYIEPYIRETLRMVLPYVRGYEQQKEDVNAECGRFRDLLIE